MLNFDFYNKTKIFFGKDVELQAGSLCKATGAKVLLHYGGGSIKKSGLYDRIVKSLNDADVQFVELGGVQPNPRLSLVKEGIELCRKEKIGLILAVGGGSVADSAKAIGVGVEYAGDVWDFYMGKASPEKMLPVAVVLTIPAAGSEASPSSVISNEEAELKKGLTNIILRPEFSLLNPELTYTLPDYQTACGIADMLAHVMERYFTTTKGVELSDRLCESVMKTVIHQAYRVMQNPEDYTARAEIMWAGTIAHNDMIGCGRSQDWSSHGIEHEISAIYDVAHGAGLSVVFPAWMKHVYKSNVGRFARFAHEVFNVDYDFENPESTALQGIAELEQFFRDINLPVRLSDMDIDDTNIEKMASKVTDDGSHTIGGFKELTKSDIQNILNLALK
ncbi:MAG: iron-containing alcohol dehydrogenase [Spirochaetes bacterium]|jgi:alcohol dehydrogenase YqhD (iron-dependent ADH family)|nr:iron-containing alcohol dehydrogenase [Spirochaetota bacterium]